MKIKGELYHEIERLGNEDFVHIGFRDKEGKFQDIMAKMVPEIGMTKKVEIIMKEL